MCPLTCVCFSILFLRSVRGLFVGYELRRRCFGGKATRKEDTAEGDQGRDRALRQRQQGRFKASGSELVVYLYWSSRAIGSPFVSSAREGPLAYARVWCSRP